MFINMKFFYTFDTKVMKIKEKLYLRKVPLLRVLIPYILGIIIGYQFNNILTETTLLILKLLIAFIVLIQLSLLTVKKKFLSGFTIKLLIFFVALFMTQEKMFVKERNRDNVLFTGVLFEEVVFKEKSVQLSVLIDSDGRKKLAGNNMFGVRLYTSPDSVKFKNYKVGDRIVFRAYLNNIENYRNPEEFDFKGYLARKGFYYQAYVPDTLLVNLGNSGEMPVRRLAGTIKSRAVGIINEYDFFKESKALVVALTVGEKDFITEGMRKAFTNSGAIHVLAVSGLHVGIIYMILGFLLKFMDNGQRTRIIKMVIIVLVIWSYAFITGLSASVTRAALMFTLINIGSSLNRDISFFNVLSGAALIMLVINPLQLFDVGFQLSFLAVGGIVYFQPIIYSWFEISNPVVDSIYKLISVSLAAQITTAPLTIFYFHQFPVYFWITNVLIIPLVFLLLLGSIVFLALSWVPLIKSGIGWGINYLALLTNKWVKLVDSIPGALLENIYISMFIMVCVYFLLISITIWLKNRNNLFVPVSLLILFLMSVNYLIASKPEKEGFTVYNVPGETVLGIYTEEENWLLYNKKEQPKNLDFAVKNHWLKKGVSKSISAFSLQSLGLEENQNLEGRKPVVPLISLNDEVLMFYEGQVPELNLEKRRYIDYLIVGQNSVIPAKRLNVGWIIVDSSVKGWLAKKWEKYAASYNIQIYNVKLSGAFNREIHSRT